MHARHRRRYLPHSRHYDGLQNPSTRFSYRVTSGATTVLVAPPRYYVSVHWQCSELRSASKPCFIIVRRAARFVLQQYRRTSSVGNMIGELDWQSLEERRRVASLMMFFKIHNNLVATEMPGSLTPEQHVKPTRKENSLAYQVPEVRPRITTGCHTSHALPGCGTHSQTPL